MSGESAGINNVMSTTTSIIDWQKVSEKLADKRRELFDCWLAHPEKIQLAAEIRRLDDELFVCAERARRAMRRNERKLFTGRREF